jgi:ribosomal protein S18 acetylase RimI-like enzyme
VGVRGSFEPRLVTIPGEKPGEHRVIEIQRFHASPESTRRDSVLLLSQAIQLSRLQEACFQPRYQAGIRHILARLEHADVFLATDAKTREIVGAVVGVIKNLDDPTRVARDVTQVSKPPLFGRHYHLIEGLVKPGLQGYGIARELVKEMRIAAEEMKLNTIYVLSLRGSRSGRKVLESIGFIESPAQPADRRKGRILELDVSHSSASAVNQFNDYYRERLRLLCARPTRKRLNYVLHGVMTKYPHLTNLSRNEQVQHLSYLVTREMRSRENAREGGAREGARGRAPKAGARKTVFLRNLPDYVRSFLDSRGQFVLGRKPVFK